MNYKCKACHHVCEIDWVPCGGIFLGCPNCHHWDLGALVQDNSMQDRSKSILDNRPIDDTNYHLRKPPQGGSSTTGQMVIVGHCPSCGSPIYGNNVVHFNDLKGQMPVVSRSCSCVPDRKSFEDLVQTK